MRSISEETVLTDEQKNEPAVEHDEQIEDLDVEGTDAEHIKGGAVSSLAGKHEPGVEAQHNETLLRA